MTFRKKEKSKIFIEYMHFCNSQPYEIIDKLTKSEKYDSSKHNQRVNSEKFKKKIKQYLEKINYFPKNKIVKEIKSYFESKFDSSKMQIISQEINDQIVKFEENKLEQTNLQTTINELFQIKSENMLDKKSIYDSDSDSNSDDSDDSDDYDYE